MFAASQLHLTSLVYLSEYDRTLIGIICSIIICLIWCTIIESGVRNTFFSPHYIKSLQYMFSQSVSKNQIFS